MSCSLEYGTVLPTRVIPTTTLMIFVIIVSKFRVKIIVANEKNVTTPTTDIAMSKVNVTFKLRFFVLCPDLYFYFFVALIFFNSLAANGLCLLRAGILKLRLVPGTKKISKYKLPNSTSPQHEINTLLCAVSFSF